MINKHNSGIILFWGGIVFAVIVSLWPILMVASEVSGTLEEQLWQIYQYPDLYMGNFFIASLIAPGILVLMATFAFFVETRRRIPILDWLGGISLAVYAAFVSVSYTSQYAYLPRLLDEGKVEVAKLWYFGSNFSVSYFFNQLGYACFGMAALLIGYKLLFEIGIPKIIGILLWVSGFLSLVAFAGYVLQIGIQGFVSIFSGVLTLPIGVLSAIWGRKLLRELNKGKGFRSIFTA